MKHAYRQQLHLWGMALDDVSLVDYLGGGLIALLMRTGLWPVGLLVFLALLYWHKRNALRKFGRNMGHAHAFLKDVLIAETLRKAMEEKR